MPGYEDPIYKYKIKPRTIDEYLQLAKNNEHKSIGNYESFYK